MIDEAGDITEAIAHFREAEKEFDLGHYHLVVGNLIYALHLLEEIGEDEHDLMGEIYHLLCRSHLELKHYAKVDYYWELGYQFYLGRDLYKVCEFDYLNGVTAARQRKERRAIRSYQKVLQALEDDYSERALPIRTRCWFNLANCYIRSQDFLQARKGYLYAYRLQHKWDNPGLKGKILLGIGVTYQHEQKKKSTIRCYQKALRYIYPSNHIAYGRLVHNLADLYLNMGKFEEARDLFEESLREVEICAKLDRARVISSYRGLAQTYLHENVKKVKYYSMKALELILEQGVTKFSSVEETDLAKIFKLLCYWMVQERRLEECKLYFIQARTIFQKYGLHSELETLNNLMAK